MEAALPLYFFQWSKYMIGSKHTIRSVSKMIHILVSGNMNHRAGDLTLHLVRNNVRKEGFCILLLKALYETYYGKEDVALTFEMKHYNIFTSIGVRNSLLKATGFVMGIIGINAESRDDFKCFYY